MKSARGALAGPAARPDRRAGARRRRCAAGGAPCADALAGELRSVGAVSPARSGPGSRWPCFVTIDRRSSELLSLPRKPADYGRCVDLRIGPIPSTHQKLPPPHQVHQWPRCLHQRVWQALTAAGARAIVFDVSFRPRRAKSADEQKINEAVGPRLRAAIRAAGNVLLARRIDYVLDAAALPDAGKAEDTLAEMSELSPAARSVGARQRCLPVGAGQVSSASTRSSTFGGGGWRPTPNLPALALQLVAADAYAEFARLLTAAAPQDADGLPRDGEELRARQPLQASMLLVRYLVQTRRTGVESGGNALARPIRRRSRPREVRMSMRWSPCIPGNPCVTSTSTAIRAAFRA